MACLLALVAPCTALAFSVTGSIGGTVQPPNASDPIDVGAVTLTADTVIGRSDGTGPITFSSPISSTFRLTVISSTGSVTFDAGVAGAALAVSTSGTVSVNAALGSGTPLSSFTGGNNSIVLGANVSSAGTVTMNAPVILLAAASISGSQVFFNGTVDGAQDLTVDASSVQFTANVGGSNRLNSLRVTRGTASFLSSIVGANTADFIGQVDLLASSVTFNIATTIFGSALVGPSTSLLISGNASFTGVVLLGAVEVGGDAVLSSDFSAGAQVWDGSVTHVGSVAQSGALLSFLGPVSLVGPGSSFFGFVRFLGGAGSVTGTAPLTFGPLAASDPYEIGAGGLMPGTSLAALANGFPSITFGTALGSGTMTIDAATWQDPVIFREPAGTIVTTGSLARIDNATFAFDATRVELGGSLLPAGTAPYFVPLGAASPAGSPSTLLSPAYYALDVSSGMTAGTLAFPLCPGGAASQQWNGSAWTSLPFTALASCDSVTLDASSSPTLAAAQGGVRWFATGGAAPVTSFTGPSATGTGAITASFTGGGAACTFAAPAYIAPPPGRPPVPPVEPPSGIVFPHGLFDFHLASCTAGGTVSFTIVYPSALPAGTQYYKYGATAADPAPHWYVLPATISGNTAAFSITDGGEGDDDLAANQAIVDPGGPGFPGASGILPVPTLDDRVLAILALLLAALGGWRMRPDLRGIHGPCTRSHPIAASPTRRAPACATGDTAADSRSTRSSPKPPRIRLPRC